MVGVWSARGLVLIVQLFEFKDVAGNTFGPTQISSAQCDEGNW
jgi:hypothetical protein